MRGDTDAGQVARCGENAKLEVANLPGHQRLILYLAAAHHAIDVLTDHIHDPVADAHVDLDVRVAQVKLGQCGD